MRSLKEKNRGRKREVNGGQGVLEESIKLASTVGDGIGIK